VALTAGAVLVSGVIACLMAPVTSMVQVSSRAAPPGGQLVRAQLTADLTSAADIAVQLQYTMRVDSGAERVPLALLRWRGVSVDELQASVQGEPVALQFTEQGRRTSGWIELPSRLQQRELHIELQYHVRSAAPGPRVRIPVLAVLWPPADARPGVFTAEVRMRSERRAARAFPTSLRSVPAGGPYHASLQVVPSIIAFSIGNQAELQRAPPSSEAVAQPGFVFWGLFVVLGGICVLYLLWLWRTERA
jgi:hypothetical protein